MRSGTGRRFSRRGPASVRNIAETGTMMLLKAEDYRKTPWKNGSGETEDILLLPEGASHEDFDIRISRAPIVDDSRFSVFPGIDRTITRLGENPLTLCFLDDREMELGHLSPVSFDSTLAPTSLLPAGPSRVMNVMTRRGRWQADVSALHGPVREKRAVPSGGMIVVHAVRGDCMVAGRRIARGDTLVMQEEIETDLSLEADGACLIAAISPAGSLQAPG